MKNFCECKTEEEKQVLRDAMVEQMYYQIIATRADVCKIKEAVGRIEKKLIYVGANEAERKYINADGSLKLDIINDTCDHILSLYGDKYVNGLEVNNNASNEC